MPEGIFPFKTAIDRLNVAAAFQRGLSGMDSNILKL